MTSTMEKLQELRTSGVQIFIKNNTKTIVTINDDSGRLELGPVGSVDGILSLPDSKLSLPGLQRMISKGTVSVGKFDDFRDDWNDAEGKDRAASPLDEFQVTVEADKGKKDLVEKECIVTGKPVFQSLEEVKSDKPPLHESVAHLEKEFVVRHVEKPEGGHEVTWDRVVVEGK